MGPRIDGIRSQAIDGVSQIQRDELFQVGWGRCVVVTVGERPGSPVYVVLRGLEGTAIGAGAVHEARLGGTFPLTAACSTVLM